MPFGLKPLGQSACRCWAMKARMSSMLSGSWSSCRGEGRRGEDHRRSARPQEGPGCQGGDGAGTLAVELAYVLEGDHGDPFSIYS